MLHQSCSRHDFCLHGRSGRVQSQYVGSVLKYYTLAEGSQLKSHLEYLAIRTLISAAVVWRGFLVSVMFSSWARIIAGSWKIFPDLSELGNLFRLRYSAFGQGVWKLGQRKPSTLSYRADSSDAYMNKGGSTPCAGGLPLSQQIAASLYGWTTRHRRGKEDRMRLLQVLLNSPFLFVLYIAPLFLTNWRVPLAMLTISLPVRPLFDENSQALSAALHQAITFDPEKSELLHFSRKHKDVRNSPAVVAGSFTVRANRTRAYLKSLGVLDYRKLTFKYHALA